jgi:hypothetical protein
MSTTDLGESLVGAYMRHIERCTIVLYNSFFADQQGEVDVVAVKAPDAGQPRLVYLCEAHHAHRRNGAPNRGQGSGETPASA